MATTVPRISPLNWYQNEIKPSFELLEVFINNIEEKIKIDNRNYENNKEISIVEEDSESHNATFIDSFNGLNSLTWNLENIFFEYFPNLQRRSAFITLYSFLETELDKLCILYKREENYKIDFKDLQNSGIERSVRYLEIVVNLPIEKCDIKWGTVKSIQNIRNLFVHNDGKFSNTDGKLKKVNIIKEIKHKLLSLKEDDIIIKEGYLKFVLASFDIFFKHIDELIQLR